MKIRIGREGMALCLLTAALCAVFALSVQMYDTLESETADGALAAAAQAAQRLLGENDAVAAFFGMEDASGAAAADAAGRMGAADAVNAANTAGAAEDARIRADAAAYILRYNQIYAALQ